jgi:hypothetical protein
LKGPFADAIAAVTASSEESLFPAESGEYPAVGRGRRPRGVGGETPTDDRLEKLCFALCRKNDAVALVLLANRRLTTAAQARLKGTG